MIHPWFNWRTGLAVIAIAIVTATIFYSQFLARKIAAEERDKVELWVEASKAALTLTDLTLPNLIRNEQRSIPIIETNERDSIISFINLDSASAANDPDYLPNKLRKFKKENDPFVIVLSEKPYAANKYYYGHTALLDQVRYYPLVQLLIVSLFIIITITALTTRFRSTQNQLWAGMAKETAHQLGTPITSLQGWVEMQKENNPSDAIVIEMEKDVNRLKLVSERFSKIGSAPNLEERNIIEQVLSMVDYIKKRASGKVQFNVDTHGESAIPVRISPALFDWVIENLLKNALDAMEGKGKISIDIRAQADNIQIDVTDTGKGIARQHVGKVFKPGFTTKKRGWGLGLSLSKRIIEQFHKGQLYVKSSELGKGTTFRIVLPKQV
ncbi:MAG TPA: HAMP domain-containing sensor histidine kinase [Chitinophagaceae bacterium]|nr:HAMP domain-containing sensor histidine kinase [Chitinophagaceae bacterium]